jgi:hypothetical protein
MKSLLNEYIYKTNKEFYKCSLSKILKELKKCLKIEDDCKKKQKNIQNGGGVVNNIIDVLLNNFKKKLNNIISKCIIEL